MKSALALVAVAATAFAMPANALPGPLICSGSCTIEGGSLAFIPPVVLVSSGSIVQWIANDGNAHVNQDAGTGDLCFVAPFNGDTPTNPIRFDSTPSGLLAVTDPGTIGETSTLCGNAVALPTGGFVLSYVCVLHPVLMKGALVVGAA